MPRAKNKRPVLVRFVMLKFLNHSFGMIKVYYKPPAVNLKSTNNVVVRIDSNLFTVSLLLRRGSLAEPKQTRDDMQVGSF